MQNKHRPIESTEERTKSILSEMKNQSITSSGVYSRQQVSSLVPNKEVKRIELVVLRRYPRRLVNSTNYIGSLAAACGRDETGLIGLVLWGDQVDRVRTGDVIQIRGGWCRYSHGQKVISTGRTGSLTILEA